VQGPELKLQNRSPNKKIKDITALNVLVAASRPIGGAI
jgi:hypothetical protein